MSDYTSQLFAHLPPERLSTFSCGHIIPPQNLQAVILGHGPRGSELEFKFANRDDPALVRFSHLLVTECFSAEI
jgi:chromosome transmission fidelity protein 1